MKLIEDHGMDEEIAVRLFGWKWMSYVGIPIRGTEGYPKECRVRELFSPTQLKMPEWIEHFAKHEGREAEGTEPLAYCYCSSSGWTVPPRIVFLVMEACK